MQKVGVDNHNPVETSNKQARATPQIFCKVHVCVTVEPKN